MHRSLEGAAGTWHEMRRCMPHGSLPPCGGGTGRGVATRHEREVSPVQKDSIPTAGLHLLGRRYKTKVVRVVPPSLSLPHKGGGNHVAPLCPTANQRTRRCVHALAPARGRQRRVIASHVLSRDERPRRSALA